jgi:CRP-like cAMP-binding protein
MRKALYILGQLNDNDVEWLVGSGEKRKLTVGEVLIQEGTELDALFLVLDGELAVLTHQEGTTLGKRSTGDILGEMSFVDGLPASATVQVIHDTAVLAIPRLALSKKLEADPAFAGRFYRAVSIFLSDRVREMVALIEPSTANSAIEDDELSPEVLDNIFLAGARFERILKKIAEG